MLGVSILAAVATRAGSAVAPALDRSDGWWITDDGDEVRSVDYSQHVKFNLKTLEVPQRTTYRTDTIHSTVL